MGMSGGCCGGKGHGSGTTPSQSLNEFFLWVHFFFKDPHDEGQTSSDHIPDFKICKFKK